MLPQINQKEKWNSINNPRGFGAQFLSSQQAGSCKLTNDFLQALPPSKRNKQLTYASIEDEKAPAFYYTTLNHAFEF